jgi:hypothetical protein
VVEWFKAPSITLVMHSMISGRLLKPLVPARLSIRITEGWPSGLRRPLGKRVYGNVTWVRIPSPPPFETKPVGTFGVQITLKDSLD